MSPEKMFFVSVVPLVLFLSTACVSQEPPPTIANPSEPSIAKTLYQVPTESLVSTVSQETKKPRITVHDEDGLHSQNFQSHPELEKVDSSTQRVVTQDAPIVSLTTTDDSLVKSVNPESVSATAYETPIPEVPDPESSENEFSNLPNPQLIEEENPSYPNINNFDISDNVPDSTKSQQPLGRPNTNPNLDQILRGRTSPTSNINVPSNNVESADRNVVNSNPPPPYNAFPTSGAFMPTSPLFPSAFNPPPPQKFDDHDEFLDSDTYIEEHPVPVDPHGFSGNCPNNMFECRSDHTCIPKIWVCDSDQRQDCEDGSDESPEVCTDNPCKEGEYKCPNGNCIPDKWRCDGEDDCDGGADEDPNKCRAKECEADQFTCHKTDNRSRHCIPLNWVCDSKPDCYDGSDERSCNATCTSEQFTCATGRCISLYWRCDGDSDCGEQDDSDEKDCPPTTCNGNEAPCGDGTCVQKAWYCDGEPDCSNGMDELNCTSTSSILLTCQHDQVLCPKEPTCLKKEYLCDGDQDCASGWDERPELCDPCGPSNFTCGDRSCLDIRLRCNGFPECADGSDERGCPSVACNASSEYDCGRGNCINSALVCDGIPHCSNNADENHCGLNECLRLNGGCSHKCVDDVTGFHCECHPGYYLIDDSTCIDVNECLEPGICSQLCVNLKGSYKCECVNGYSKDPHDPAKCKAMEGHASLLLAHNSDIRKISLDHQEVTAIVNATKGATALDFVFKTGMIFWTDIRDKCIYKAPIDEGSKKVVVVTDDVTNADGLAVDWLYNHLYWTNSDKNAIEVSDFNGNMRKTLINDSIDEPRAIAIFPMEGWMFWTDWGMEPKIEKAGMDGTHRQAIIMENIKWPNALTIDYVLRKLYWADSKVHGIFSSDFDGRNRRTIIQSMEVLLHPFSITVFEDHIYWTDWTKEAILSANKFTGSDITTLAHLHTPMTVHVYHSYRQPNGTNYCTPLNGLCTHLCLPAPQLSAMSPKTTCTCPDGMDLMRDNYTCTEIVSIPDFIDTGVYGAAEVEDTASNDAEGTNFTVVAALSTLALVVLAALMSFMIYRYCRKRSIHSMNFDNPVYKKSSSSNSNGGTGHFSSSPPYGTNSSTHFTSNYNNSTTSMEDAFHMVAAASSNNTSSSSFGGAMSGGTSTFSNNTNSSFSSTNTNTSSTGGGGNTSGAGGGTGGGGAAPARNPRLQYGVTAPEESVEPLTGANCSNGYVAVVL